MVRTIETEARVDPHQGWGHPGDTTPQSHDTICGPLDGFLTDPYRILSEDLWSFTFCFKGRAAHPRRATRAHFHSREPTTIPRTATTCEQRSVYVARDKAAQP